MAARSPFDPLKDAARYVRAFRDKPFVVKLGGHILADAALRESVCGQLALLHGFAIPLVVVHGGARQITSPEVLEASKMALKGTLQMDLLGSMHAAGLHAVGLSGQDAWMLHAHRRPPVSVDGQIVDYGCVGDIDHVDARLLRHLIAGGYVPVIAPFTADASQNIFNTNADTVAASIAVALGAEKLFFVVQAPGLLSDPNDPTTLQPLVDLPRLAELEARGAIQDGMKPKIAAARSALAGGVKSIHIVSGLLPDAILAEVFTNEGSGTMFVVDASV